MQRTTQEIARCMTPIEEVGNERASALAASICGKLRPEAGSDLLSLLGHHIGPSAISWAKSIAPQTYPLSCPLRTTGKAQAIQRGNSRSSNPKMGLKVGLSGQRYCCWASGGKRLNLLAESEVFNNGLTGRGKHPYLMSSLTSCLRSRLSFWRLLYE